MTKANEVYVEYICATKCNQMTISWTIQEHCVLASMPVLLNEVGIVGTDLLADFCQYRHVWSRIDFSVVPDLQVPSAQNFLLLSADLISGPVPLNQDA